MTVTQVAKPSQVQCRPGERQTWGAEGRERVVRHLARPDQIPERLLKLDRLHSAAVHLGDVRDQVRPERGPALEPRPDRVVQRLGGRV